MRKTIQQEHYSCCVQKTAPKTTKYSRNETIFKMGHFAKTTAHAKDMLKTILQERWSCSVQKTAPKNTNYPRNDTTLKIGHFPKTIAHAKAKASAKWSVWVKN